MFACCCALVSARQAYLHMLPHCRMVSTSLSSYVSLTLTHCGRVSCFALKCTWSGLLYMASISHQASIWSPGTQLLCCSDNTLRHCSRLWLLISLGIVLLSSSIAPHQLCTAITTSLAHCGQKSLCCRCLNNHVATFFVANVMIGAAGAQVTQPELMPNVQQVRCSTSALARRKPAPQLRL